MDVTDFTKGIYTDIDPQDGAGVPSSLRDGVNFDLWPGRTEKRQGTQEKQYPLAAGGTIPTLYQKVIQVCVIHAPLGKADSVRDFTASGGTEVCLNTDVTVVLVQHVNLNAYQLYADIYAQNQFVQMQTPEQFNEFHGIGEDIPFMIPRVGAVAIGGVRVFGSGGAQTSEKGVLWFGHIKRLAGWTRTAPGGAYEYMSAVDEWRLSNAECYDSLGDLRVQVRISSYEKMWTELDTTKNPLHNKFPIPATNPIQYYEPLEVLEKGLSPFLVGHEKRKFRLKVTAMYDGFQESRPLTWTEARHELVQIDDAMGTIYGEAQMPRGWKVEADKEHNQHLRVEIDDSKARAVATWGDDGESYEYPRNSVPGSSVPLGGLRMLIELVWNAVWYENAYPFQTGEDFYVLFDWRRNSEETNIGYNWEWNGSIRIGLTIRVRGEDATRIFTPKFIEFLLGKTPPSLDEIRRQRTANPVGMQQHDYWYFLEKFYDITSWEAWKICHEFWTVGRCEYSTNPALYAGDPDPYHPISDPSTFALKSMTFKLKERHGIGLMQICPIIPREYVLGASGSINTMLTRGARRLTGFRFYVMEDGTDIDFRLVTELSMDYNQADPDHGGFIEEDENQIIGYREMGLKGNCPTWMDDGTSIVPYYNVGSGVGEYRGGINSVFLVTNDMLKDKAGVATLSGNLLRDETERDNPAWIRGGVCEGRLFGISMDDGDMQYCIFAGGTPQYDIMPDAFHVAKGETITHIVSFRGQHHLIFTDQNLWRFDLADGDEFNWRIMDTFAKRGTTCWRAIVETPYGIVYPNDQGIWLYDGNRPESMIKGKWLKRYLAHWSAKTAYDKTYGAFNAGRDEVFLTLFAGEDPQDDYPDVWICDFATMGWRKYRYMDASGNYARPQYMVWHGGEFLQSFDYGDFRAQTGDLTDLGIPYPCYGETQELPPLDQTQVVHFQYFGTKYESPQDYPARMILTFAPYRHQIHLGKRILTPPTRREYFFPVPLGISRNMKVLFGQGTLIGDVTNSDEPVVFSSFSVRGYNRKQWSGTR